MGRRGGRRWNWFRLWRGAEPGRAEHSGWRHRLRHKLGGWAIRVQWSQTYEARRWAKQCRAGSRSGPKNKERGRDQDWEQYWVKVRWPARKTKEGPSTNNEFALHFLSSREEGRQATKSVMQMRGYTAASSTSGYWWLLQGSKWDLQPWKSSWLWYRMVRQPHTPWSSSEDQALPAHFTVPWHSSDFQQK